MPSSLCHALRKSRGSKGDHERIDNLESRFLLPVWRGSARMNVVDTSPHLNDAKTILRLLRPPTHPPPVVTRTVDAMIRTAAHRGHERPFGLTASQEVVALGGDLNLKTNRGPGSFNAGFTPLHMACAYG